MIQQRTQSWLLEQASTFGSTAAGVVGGENKYQTPGELFDVMHAARAGRIVPKEPNDDMRRGLITEPIHRELLEEATGEALLAHDQNEFLLNEAYPWAHALPDGWMDYAGELVPVQLKCPRARNWHEIKLKGIHGYWLLGSQHSMAVCDAQTEYFSVLNPETMRLLHFPIARDQNLIDDLMGLERTFWEALQAGERPVEQSEKPIELPPINGELLTLDTTEAADAADAYREAQLILKEAEALKFTAAERIKQLMGEAEVAELAGLRVYHRRQAGRKRLDIKAAERDGIDLSPYYTSTASFRSFRTYEVSA